MPLPLLTLSVAALVCTLEEPLPTPAAPVRLTAPPVTQVLRLPSSCTVLPAPAALSVIAPLPALTLPTLKWVLAAVLATVIAPPLEAALASSRSAEWRISMAPPRESTEVSTEGAVAAR